MSATPQAEDEGRSIRHAWIVLTACTAVWLVVAAGVGGLLVVDAALGDLRCPLRDGASIYGTAGWHWVPPGVSCHWDVTARDSPTGHAIHRTENPPWWTAAVASVLVASGAALVWRAADLAVRRAALARGPELATSDGGGPFAG